MWQETGRTILCVLHLVPRQQLNKTHLAHHHHHSHHSELQERLRDRESERGRLSGISVRHAMLKAMSPLSRSSSYYSAARGERGGTEGSANSNSLSLPKERWLVFSITLGLNQRRVSPFALKRVSVNAGSSYSAVRLPPFVRWAAWHHTFAPWTGHAHRLVTKVSMHKSVHLMRFSGLYFPIHTNSMWLLFFFHTLLKEWASGLDMAVMLPLSWIMGLKVAQMCIQAFGKGECDFWPLCRVQRLWKTAGSFIRMFRRPQDVIRAPGQ